MKNSSKLFSQVNLVKNYSNILINLTVVDK